MIRKFQPLYPYLWRYRSHLAVGALMLVLSNYYDIRLAVLIGSGIDLLRADLSPVAGVQLGLLALLLLLTGVLALGAAAARFWMRRLVINASRHIEFDLRNHFFAKLLSLSPAFYDRYRTGDLMSRATSDIDAIRTVIGPSIMYLANTAAILPMTLIQMVHISPPLTILCWLPMLLIPPVFYCFSHGIHRRSRRSQELMSDLTANIQETLSGARVIKAYARESDRAEQFSAISAAYVAESMALARLTAFFFPMLRLLVGLAVLLLLWGGSFYIIRGDLGIGALVTFFLLLMASIWPMAAFGWVLAQLERGAASVERVTEIFRQTPAVGPPAEVAAPDQISSGARGRISSSAPRARAPLWHGLELPADGQADRDPQPRLRGELELRRLTFTYPQAAQPALRDVTLRVPAGTALGLTGPVGCGKSTLAALLEARYWPPRGMLFIDGVDIRDWPVDALRRQIGIVDQEPFLFSDSIGANIAYGLPTLNDDRVRAAAQTAQLHDEIAALPHAYATILGERGINLSGGQRQRAALARALARDPALLILDDALAAVDTHTEEAILRGLRAVLAGRTTILISHRISTVSLADVIVYLEDGRIVEQGTHDELVLLGGKYAALAQRQKLAEEIERTA